MTSSCLKKKKRENEEWNFRQSWAKLFEQFNFCCSQDVAGQHTLTSFSSLTSSSKQVNSVTLALVSKRNSPLYSSEMLRPAFQLPGGLIAITSSLTSLLRSPRVINISKGQALTITGFIRFSTVQRTLKQMVHIELQPLVCVGLLKISKGSEDTGPSWASGGLIRIRANCRRLLWQLSSLQKI